MSFANGNGNQDNQDDTGQDIHPGHWYQFTEGQPVV